ncbi:hypothetical protein Gotur_013432, partial [Gossypium turneri]
WDDELTLIFCELCVNEVNAGNRPTTHLNLKGWENEWRLYGGSCLRNLQVLDGVHLKRRSMLSKNGFKKKGIEPQLTELMWQMFGGIVATGENAWAPSSDVLPSGVPMGDDAPNEGFGDSDEHSNENECIPPNE